ncbi:MAG: ArsR/SmtB family transcription factor [Nitrososphaerales archaeon]
MSEEKPNKASGADLFDLLGHPTRVKIIEILSERDQSFSEIKRKIGVESSGHLQFHLSKLELGLVKLAPDGKNYTLTDEGKEALRLVAQVLESRSKVVVKTHWNGRLLSNRKSIMRTALVLAVGVLIGFSVYSGIALTFSYGNNLFQAPNCTRQYAWQSVPSGCYAPELQIVSGEEYFADYNLTNGEITATIGMNRSQVLNALAQYNMTCPYTQSLPDCINSNNYAVQIWQPGASATSCIQRSPTSCPILPEGMIDVTNSPYLSKLAAQYCGECSGPIKLRVNVQTKQLELGAG